MASIEERKSHSKRKYDTFKISLKRWTRYIVNSSAFWRGTMTQEEYIKKFRRDCQGTYKKNNGSCGCGLCKASRADRNPIHVTDFSKYDEDEIGG